MIFLMFFSDIFNSVSMSLSQRSSIITLLPKSGDKTDPSNCRPIHLLCTSYKLVAKILQIRMAKILSVIGNEHLTCSFSGGSIHNNMFIVRDIIDYSVIKSNFDCALISVDQHKAFEKVSRTFLIKFSKNSSLVQNSENGCLFCIAILKVVY